MSETALDNPESAKETLASLVYDRLRQDIISVAIEPGEKLHIRSLCERFEVGLSPMREALSRLSSEGLVAQSDHRGFAVAPMDEEDLVDITRARCWLNELAIRKSIGPWRCRLGRAGRAFLFIGCRAHRASKLARSRSAAPHGKSLIAIFTAA